MKKGIKTAGGILAAALVLSSAGFYLSQTLIKWKMMERDILPTFTDGNKVMEPYPYADIEVPESFKECSIKGIDFKAPEGLFWMYPEETEGIKSGIIVDNYDIDKRKLLICVLDKEDHNDEAGLPSLDFFQQKGFFDKRMNSGLKKLGYEPPENSHDMLFLCETFDISKCNKLSPSEVNATYKLMLLKSVMVPAYISVNGVDGDTSHDNSVEPNRYYFDTKNIKSFVSESVNTHGAYELNLDVYGADDLEMPQSVIIVGNDTDTVRQIAKTVTIAEDTE